LLPLVTDMVTAVLRAMIKQIVVIPGFFEVLPAAAWAST
jgi:hypothetical protein